MRCTSQGGACACHAHGFSVAQRLLQKQLACAFHFHMRLHNLAWTFTGSCPLLPTSKICTGNLFEECKGTNERNIGRLKTSTAKRWENPDWVGSVAKILNSQDVNKCFTVRKHWLLLIFRAIALLIHYIVTSEQLCYTHFCYPIYKYPIGLEPPTAPKFLSRIWFVLPSLCQR